MRKFKGFTLIELIIVMAIMVLIMAALMNMMKPIRATYVDSTYYEAERNTQSGIATYITESVRYATNLGVYTDDKVNTGASPASISGIRQAIDQFKAETGITDESKIHVITIDNTTAYTYNNAQYYGRLVRTKKPDASTGKYTADAANADSAQARLALGGAYYGDNTYSISVKTTDNGIEVQVSSILSDSLKKKTKGTSNSIGLNAKDSEGKSVYDAAGNPGKLVTTVAEVTCPNVAGMVKTSGSFSKNYAGSTTTAGKNTYIIFTLPE